MVLRSRLVTVSPFTSSKGAVPGLTDQLNDGADFGPETPGTKTGGLAEAEEALRSIGGVITLIPGAPIQCQVPVTFYSGVHIVGNGATLLNAGKSPNPFRTDPSAVFLRTRFEGPLVLDHAFGPKSTVFTVTSAQHSSFDVSIENFSGSVGMALTVNDAVEKSVDGNWGGQNRNNRIWVEGHKGAVLLRVEGKEGCAVTLNDIYYASGNQMGMDGSLVRLIDFVRNCDNNQVFSSYMSIHQNAAPGSCEFYFGSAGPGTKVRRNRIYKSTLDNRAPSASVNVAIFGGGTPMNELLGIQYGVNPPDRVIVATPTDTYHAIDLMAADNAAPGGPQPTK